jgi:chromate transporter
MIKPSLKELTWFVARDVNRTLGGLASMELLRRTMGDRGWLSADSHALLVAVSRITPGTTILAYCTALGWVFHGWQGAAVSLAAASIPASLLIAILTATLERIDQHPVVRVLIAVGLVIATLLVLSAAWNLLRPYVKETTAVRTGVIVMVAVGLMLAGITPVRIMFVAAVVGIIMASPAPPVAPVAEPE